MTTTKIDTIPDAQTKARLEFTYEHTGPEEVLVRYELVLPLNEFDCRGTFDHKPAKAEPKSHRRMYLSKSNCLRMPLGLTRVGTSNANYPFSSFDGSIELPFRDGVHRCWDQDKLGVECYALTPKGIYHVAKPEPKVV